jgi:hypothetical protein
MDISKSMRSTFRDTKLLRIKIRGHKVSLFKNFDLFYVYITVWLKFRKESIYKQGTKSHA